MRTIRKHITYTKIAATLAVFLAAGGGAWAASSTGKTIHACFKRHGGALRIAGRCKHGERPLSWNQIGPSGASGAKGATGKTGKAGPQGLPGAAGPSDVYAVGEASGTLGSEYFPFGTLSVPAGSYLIEAKATLLAESPASQMTCALTPGLPVTTKWDTGTVSAEVKSTSPVLSLIGAKSFAGTQTIELVCKFLKGTGKVENTRVVAIKTAALHGETPAA
jgi:hypothetical protein